VSQAVVERDGGLRRILGSVQDISDRRCAERELDARIAASEALVDWKAFEQGATGVLRNLGEALAFGAGVMWIPDCDVLVARVVWHSGSIDFSEVESVIGELRLRRGQCLPGRVWERGEPLGAPGTDANPSYAAEVAAGLRGAVALPAKHAGEVLAVVEFYLCEPADAAVTDRLLRSLSSIGCELGRFLAGRRGELKPLPLTPRELEVLQLAAQGHSAREIAERLVLSPATVRTHFEHIYEKYGVSQRASAVAQALREGLIE
jgi:DNA-binding CsgD family transcriptional regulator